MSTRVLIDSSVWITFFRGKNETVVRAVGDLLRKNQAVISGVILIELLQGAANEMELEKILKLLEPVERIEPAGKDWESAGRLSHRLRKKGQTISTVDVLIATLAIENGCPLYTEDSHFDFIREQSDLELYRPE